jgi:hypothetical protein
MARLAALAVAAAVVPMAWQTHDAPLRFSVVLGAAFLGVRAVLARSTPRDPGVRYDAMLEHAAAIRVDLLRTRILQVHRGLDRSTVTVAWRGARSVLLDADARTLATAPRNGLTSAYTMTLVVDDRVAELLDHHTGLGEVSVYAVVDLLAHPEGNLRQHGLVVEQYDVSFAAWTGSLPTHRVLQPWDH